MSSQDHEPTGSFTTYLQMLRQEAAEPVSADDAETALLTTLARSGPLGMDDWLRLSGLELGPFADALKSLEQRGLIAPTGPAEHRQFALTDEGRRHATSIG